MPDDPTDALKQQLAAQAGDQSSPEELLRRLGMGSRAEFVSFQDSLGKFYADAMHGTHLSMKVRTMQGLLFVNAGIEELRALALTDEFKKLLDEIATKVDELPEAVITKDALKDGQGLVKAAFGIPLGGNISHTNYAPVGLEMQMLQQEEESLYTHLFREMNPLLFTVARLLHTVPGPDGKPLLPWRVQDVSDRQVDLGVDEDEQDGEP